MKGLHNVFRLLVFAAWVCTASQMQAQTPDEHAKHHPQAAADTPAMNPADTGGGMKSTGGMGNMGEMMKNMGVPPQKELYPSLMQEPLTPEKRQELSQRAEKQIAEGNHRVTMGMNQLSEATRNMDFKAMDEATLQIRRGQSFIRSGMAVQQALNENVDPRKAALKWFKQNMNLAPAVTEEQPHGFFGLSWFHYIAMLFFVAFFVAMIWMYFHKMKRANALVARLEGNTGVPLPASTALVAPSVVTEPSPAVNPDIAPTKSNSWSGSLTVAAIFDETPSVKTFRLTDPESGKLPFTYLPGQFITVTIAPAGVPVRRSYTIASSPTHRDYCEITVKHEEKGTVSHFLHAKVRVGNLLQLTGPSGKLTFTENEGDSVVLIAGGVGVTPMMSVVRYLTDRSWKGDIYFFFTCKSEENIIFREEIEYLQKRYPNLHVTILLDVPGSKPSYVTGRISKEILAARVPEIHHRRIHICGPPPMMDAVKGMLLELNVPVDDIKTEVFAGKLPAPKAVPQTPQEAAKTSVATFVRSKKTAVMPPEKTVLEASEDVGVNIDYSCRVGTCGICKTKLLSGKVKMDVEDALTPEDKAQNIILACQAKATEDINVDA